jgi:hypothetical protein
MILVILIQNAVNAEELLFVVAKGLATLTRMRWTVIYVILLLY